jgi:hypothetical protein
MVGEIITERETLSDLIEEHLGQGVFRVRSRTYPDVIYTVNTRMNSCSCPATVQCWHLRVCKVRAGSERRERRQMRRRGILIGLVPSCASCGTSEGRLHPVPGDHLTFFEGDELCDDCARDHGVT